MALTVRVYTSASAYYDYTNVVQCAMSDDGRAIVCVDNGDGKLQSVNLPKTQWSVVCTKPVTGA